MPLIHWEFRPNWVRFVILAFGPLAPRPRPVFFDNLALFRYPSGRSRSVREGCPKRVPMPLIHWELRPNWVRFVILAFGPLAPRP